MDSAHKNMRIFVEQDVLRIIVLHLYQHIGVFILHFCHA